MPPNQPLGFDVTVCPEASLVNHLLAGRVGCVTMMESPLSLTEVGVSASELALHTRRACSAATTNASVPLARVGTPEPTPPIVGALEH